MAEGLSYGITLEDRMSGPAASASQSLAALATDLASGKRALAAYQSQLALSKQTGDVDAYRNASQAVAEQKLKVLGLSAAYSTAAQTLHPLVEEEKRLAASASLAEKAAKGSAMEIAKATKFAAEEKKRSSLESALAQKSAFDATAAAAAAETAAITGGLSLVAAGVVAATAVLGGFIIKGAELAIEATQGKMAMVSMFSALGGGIVVGEETESMLGELSERIGVTKNELAPFTKSFMAMGIEGKEALEKVTLAAASAQAILGDPKAALAFENLTKKIQVAVQTGQGLKIPAKGLGSLAEMGVRVDEVAKRMNISSGALAEQLKNGTVNAKEFGDALQSALIDKGAGPLQRMGSSVANIRKMFGQSIEDMFEDMEKSIDPFMVQLKEFFSIFSQSTNSGKAMKAAIGGAFQYVFHYATLVIPYIHRGFLRMILYSLTAAVFIKKHWKEISTVLTVAGYAIAGIGILLAGLGAMVVAPFVIAGAAVYALGAGLIWLNDKFFEIVKGAAEAGANLVVGFVNGIKGGIGSIADAATDMAGAAVGGLKNALGMKSPSKVMFQLGGFAASPFAGGIDAGVPQVEAAGANLGAAAAGGTASGMRAGDYKLPGADAGSAAGGGGMTINGGIKLEITAPSGVTHALEITETALATLFERLALQQGL